MHSQYCVLQNRIAFISGERGINMTKLYLHFFAFFGIIICVKVLFTELASYMQKKHEFFRGSYSINYFPHTFDLTHFYCLLVEYQVGDKLWKLVNFFCQDKEESGCQARMRKIWVNCISSTKSLLCYICMKPSVQNYDPNASSAATNHITV